jgi:hypothetical protein
MISLVTAKWAIILALCLGWTVTVWHHASNYTSAKYEKEKAQQASDTFHAFERSVQNSSTAGKGYELKRAAILKRVDTPDPTYEAAIESPAIADVVIPAAVGMHLNALIGPSADGSAASKSDDTMLIDPDVSREGLDTASLSGDRREEYGQARGLYRATKSTGGLGHQSYGE